MNLNPSESAEKAPLGAGRDVVGLDPEVLRRDALPPDAEPDGTSRWLWVGMARAKSACLLSGRRASTKSYRGMTSVREEPALEKLRPACLIKRRPLTYMPNGAQWDL